MDLRFRWRDHEFVITVDNLNMTLRDLKLRVQEKTGVAPSRQKIVGLYKRVRREKRAAQSMDDDEDSRTLSDLGVVMRGGREIRCTLLGSLETEVESFNSQLASAPAVDDSFDDPQVQDAAFSDDGMDTSAPGYRAVPTHGSPMMHRGESDDMNQQLWQFQAESRLQGPNQTDIVRLFSELGETADDMTASLLADNASISRIPGEFTDAVASARTQYKLLVVLLYNPHSSQSQSFVVEMLTSPLLLETLAGRFVLWTRPAPPENPDLGAMWLQSASTSLFLTQLPYVGICTCVGSQISFVDILQGTVSVDELTGRLLQAQDMHGPSLDQEMARAANTDTVNTLRQQQDDDYQRALDLERQREIDERLAKEDARAKEEARQREEEELAAKEAQRLAQEEADRETLRRQKEALLEQKRANLVPEPPVTDSSATKLKIRCADGSTFERRFPSSSTVQDVLDFLAVQGLDMEGQSLMQSFPRKQLTPSHTLAQAGLHPSAGLLLHKDDQD